MCVRWGMLLFPSAVPPWDSCLGICSLCSDQQCTAGSNPLWPATFSTLLGNVVMLCFTKFSGMFRFHDGAPYVCVRRTERPSPLESFGPQGMKLVYCVNKEKDRKALGILSYWNDGLFDYHMLIADKRRLNWAVWYFLLICRSVSSVEQGEQGTS